MSTVDVEVEGRSYQPFQCLVCQSRFTRHENLKRHAALHTRPQGDTSLSCELCSVTFSRRDLRQRHMKRKHPGHEDRRSTKRAQRERPAPVGERRTEEPQRSRATSNSISSTEYHSLQGSSQLGEQDEVQVDGGVWHPSLQYGQHQPEQTHSNYYAITKSNVATVPTSTEEEDSAYFGNALTQQPSLSEPVHTHRSAQRSTNLEESMLTGASIPRSDHSLPAQGHSTTAQQSTSYGSNLSSINFNQSSPSSLLSATSPYLLEEWSPSAAQAARGIDLFFTHISHFVPFLHRPTIDVSQIPRHLLLAVLCLAYQYGEDPSCDYQADSGANLSAHCFHRARILMASNEEGTNDLAHDITMVQAYLLLQICSMMYLCGKDSRYGLKLHSRMISLARTCGLMQPLSVESAVTGNLESLWREFVRAESHKRTLFAVHQIDALWYQCLSVPRSLSHLEIKHELPCPEDCWIAASSAEWAHRQLVMRHAPSSMQYADAVRCFLSRDSDHNSVPTFDPYGAINIAQFLISSAREVTGWSTMTGMISVERLEPLKSSLTALQPFICTQTGATKTTNASLLCEATWETAMIELQMWSPTHTGGIVEGSLDAVLSQSTYLASSCDFLCDSATAEAIQPHIDWFLHYLDASITPDFEAPWIALYAYKAFLIAWDLVRGNISGAMQIVCIPDGDVRAAVTWARRVFGRRERWRLGKIIMSCLDMLDK